MLALASYLACSHESGTVLTSSSTVALYKKENKRIFQNSNCSFEESQGVPNISKHCLEASTGTTELIEQIDVAPVYSETYSIT